MSAFTWLNIQKYNKRPNKYFYIDDSVCGFFMFDFHSEEKAECFFCIGCSKFLYQIIALLGWSLFFIWLHLTIVTSWFSSLKFLCLKKNDVFVLNLYCSPIFMNIQFDTLHIHHMHDAQQKNTYTNCYSVSIVIQNHKYLLKTKENFIRWFFWDFYFTIYRELCVCLRCLYCMPYTVSVELMHDLTVNIVQTVCCLCSVQYLLTECIDAYLPARLCVWNCKKIEMNLKRFVAGI